MINCVIVDDEPLARQVLENHIARLPELRLTGKYANAIEAFEMVTKVSTDLVFLDIKMPVLSGIDFIKRLKNPPAVIFTTAFPEYGAESYELDAVDYLMKPVTFERLTKSLARFQNLKTRQSQISNTFFKVNGKLLRLEHPDIIFVQSIKDYLIIKTAQGDHITHMTMKSITDLLPNASFRRVHRSYLVNISHVTAIGRHELILGDKHIPVGDSFKGGLLDLV